MPTDTFPDLDTLAATGPDGLLWRRGGYWKATGAFPDGSGTNLRLPANFVHDSRVQAALAAGAWVPAWVDRTTAETRILAAVKAPADGTVVRARKAAEFGQAA